MTLAVIGRALQTRKRALPGLKKHWAQKVAFGLAVLGKKSLDPVEGEVGVSALLSLLGALIYAQRLKQSFSGKSLARLNKWGSGFFY